MPKNHQFVKGVKPSWLIFKGGEIGPNTSMAIKAILSDKKHPEQGYKSSLGILRLADKYSSPRVEVACTRAKYFDRISYVTIKTILEKSLDKEPFDDGSLKDTPQPPEQHENLRGSKYYVLNHGGN
jgi:hypothetical protein